MAGPFTSQILDTVENYPFIDFPLTYGELPSKAIPYYINHSSNVKRAYIYQNFCTGFINYAEAVFIID
jgi:hypothetical protein